jgi:uncharacterized protein (TIGR01777 family)
MRYKGDTNRAMHIFIAGGSGYLGSYLSLYFLRRGHKITATGGRREHPLSTNQQFTYIRCDTTKEGTWQEALKTCQVVINLAGKTIFRHWTDRYKKQIYHSRIMTTQNIVAALPQSEVSLFCSASSVGFYGDQGDDILTESNQVGDDFLAKVSYDWETAARAAESEHIRVVVTRFGIIISRDGGAMAKMITAFKSFLGGPLGDGRQWLPWMHMADLAAAMMFIIDHPKIDGPVNFCTPHPIRNRELTRMLARALLRPAVIKTPAFVLRLLLGEFGDTLLASQRAIPEKLIQNGFEFKFNRIENAIVDILKNQRISP